MAEAEQAWAGGAALIDVKEPAAGSLGRARDDTIAAVIRGVAGRCPVSAALGEWVDGEDPVVATGLNYAKWGLAGCGQRTGWPRELASAGERLRRFAPSCRLVAVAYADWRRAKAPMPSQVCEFALEHGAGAFLLDTWGKDGTTLLDWISLEEIHQLCQRCRSGGVPVALAGSLGPEQIMLLKPAQPNWFAVRGAVCHGGRRGQDIDPTAVRRLVNLVAEIDDFHG
jgi:uncharacterized protein (UPF0264 family)